MCARGYCGRSIYGVQRHTAALASTLSLPVCARPPSLKGQYWSNQLAASIRYKRLPVTHEAHARLPWHHMTFQSEHLTSPCLSFGPETVIPARWPQPPFHEKKTLERAHQSTTSAQINQVSQASIPACRRMCTQRSISHSWQMEAGRPDTIQDPAMAMKKIRVGSVYRAQSACIISIT